MNFCLRVRSLLLPPNILKQTNANYAAKKSEGKGKATATILKKRLPVETDPVKLTNHVCGLNFYNTGEEVKLKPDEEYPEWLWTLRMGKRPPLEDLDANTIEYWERAAELQQQRIMRLKKVSKLPRMIVNNREKLAELKALRFRALAGYHYDAGVDELFK